MITQIPAAILTSKYGGKVFFGAGIGLCSFLTLLTPLTAYTGPSGVIVLRVIEGLAQVSKLNFKTLLSNHTF